jgi:hypothetical protein
MRRQKISRPPSAAKDYREPLGDVGRSQVMGNRRPKTDALSIALVCAILFIGGVMVAGALT